MELNTPWVIGSLVFLGVLVYVRVPLFLCIAALSGLAYSHWSSFAEPLTGIPLALMGILEERSLLAIPLFLFTSVILSHGEGGRQLVGLMNRLTLRLPGRALSGTVLSAVAFSALSGSSPATVMALGTALAPELAKAGYKRERVVGAITAASALGTLLPPSVAVIFYAIVAKGAQPMAAGEPLTPDVIYRAALLPTALVALLFMVVMAVFRWDKGAQRANLQDGFSPLKALLVCAVPVVVLGGLYGGWLNLLDAATLALLISVVMEVVIFRAVSVKQLGALFEEGARQVGLLLIIVALTLAMNSYLTLQGVPEKITQWTANHMSQPWQFLLMVNVILLIAGCLMDIFSATVLLAPLLVPLAVFFHLDPVWFGILFLFNLEIGFLTPPVGINLFAAAGVLRMGVMDVVRAVWPLLAWMLVALAALSVYLLR